MNGDHCLRCSHLIEEHEPVGTAEDGRELLACAVRTCHCELYEGDL